MHMAMTAPGTGTNPVYDAADAHRRRAARLRKVVVAGALVASLGLLCAFSVQPETVPRSLERLASLATGALDIFSSTSNDAVSSPSPATSFAPFVQMTESNAWLFLRDKQHQEWQGEVQKDWTVNRRWTPAQNTSAQVLRELQDQETCLTYEVRVPTGQARRTRADRLHPLQARYSKYDSQTVDSVPRPPTLGAKTALIIHLFHKVMRAPMSVDLQKHLSALITETQLGSGIDVWLSIHMGTAMSSEEQLAFLADLPQEFQNRTINFDSNQLFGKYVDDEEKIRLLRTHGGLPVRPIRSRSLV